MNNVLKWGNYKPPSEDEVLWIRNFGRYKEPDKVESKLRNRVSLQIANLKQATRIVVYYHYLHRSRTMAQLPYWILLDGIQIGVILYSLPRLSVPIQNIFPMNLLELARLWISPIVQRKKIEDHEGKQHSFSIASCAIGKSLRVVKKNWQKKYFNLPDILAVVSWADNIHHEGIIYKACNFSEIGKSGGTLHGSRNRPTGGKDQLNEDYKHIKTMFLYKF